MQRIFDSVRETLHPLRIRQASQVRGGREVIDNIECGLEIDRSTRLRLNEVVRVAQVVVRRGNVQHRGNDKVDRHELLALLREQRIATHPDAAGNQSPHEIIRVADSRLAVAQDEAWTVDGNRKTVSMAFHTTASATYWL